MYDFSQITFLFPRVCNLISILGMVTRESFTIQAFLLQATSEQTIVSTHWFLLCFSDGDLFPARLTFNRTPHHFEYYIQSLFYLLFCQLNFKHIKYHQLQQATESFTFLFRPAAEAWLAICTIQQPASQIGTFVELNEFQLARFSQDCAAVPFPLCTIISSFRFNSLF